MRKTGSSGLSRNGCLMRFRQKCLGLGPSLLALGIHSWGLGDSFPQQVAKCCTLFARERASLCDARLGGKFSNLPHQHALPDAVSRVGGSCGVSRSMNSVWNSESAVGTVLVVDDNPTTARWVGCLANHLGLNAVLAFDVGEALNRLAEQPFLAVISDLDMPGIDGFDFVRSIRGYYSELPVILMTVFCDQEREEAARSAGAMALLEKPVNTDHLTALLGVGEKAARKLSLEGMHFFSALRTETALAIEVEVQSRAFSIHESAEQAAAA